VTANPYEAIFRHNDGGTDTITVYAYTAHDAMFQAAVAYGAQHGDDGKLIHLAPPVTAWSAEEQCRSILARAMERMKALGEAK